jgi:hypothetical protein
LPFVLHDEVEISLLLSCWAVGIIVVSPIISVISDKSKCRKPYIIVGLFLLTAGTLCFAFIRIYWVMVLSRVLQGLASGIMWTLGLANVADKYEEKELGAAMGYVFAVYAAGELVGPVAGGILYDLFGYEAPFMFVLLFIAFNFAIQVFCAEGYPIAPINDQSRSKQQMDDLVIEKRKEPRQDLQHPYKTDVERAEDLAMERIQPVVEKIGNIKKAEDLSIESIESVLENVSIEEVEGLPIETVVENSTTKEVEGLTIERIEPAVENVSIEKVDGLPIETVVENSTTKEVEGLPIERIETGVENGSIEKVEDLPIETVVEKSTTEKVDGLPIESNETEKVDGLPIESNETEKVEYLPIEKNTNGTIQKQNPFSSMEKVEDLPIETVVENGSIEKVEDLPIESEKVKYLPIERITNGIIHRQNPFNADPYHSSNIANIDSGTVDENNKVDQFKPFTTDLKSTLNGINTENRQVYLVASDVEKGTAGEHENFSADPHSALNIINTENTQVSFPVSDFKNGATGQSNPFSAKVYPKTTLHITTENSPVSSKTRDIEKGLDAKSNAIVEITENGSDFDQFIFLFKNGPVCVILFGIVISGVGFSIIDVFLPIYLAWQFELSPSHIALGIKFF